MPRDGRFGDNWPAWSVGGVPADTPVVLLGDPRNLGTAAFLLMTDEDRATLEWVITQAQARRELMLVRAHSRRFWDSWTARVAGGLGVAAVLTNLAINIVHLLGGRW